MAELTGDLLGREPLAALAAVAPEGGAWLVGGAVRDHLLGRYTSDYDVVVSASPRRLARELTRRTGAISFELSEAFGGWRVLARDRSWQLDLLRLSGNSITDDLAARDLTINAIALPLSGAERLDPHGGLADLRAGRLRMVSACAFASDQLRVLRLARLRAELQFHIEAGTAGAARRAAPGLPAVAPERVFLELRQIIGGRRALLGLSAMDELGATDAVLPELAALRGVAQSRYHHLDVHAHTVAVLEQLIALGDRPETVFPQHADAVRALLFEPLADELSHGQALRFAGLLHDIAKPPTRAETPTGRVTFLGHDQLGAEMAAAILRRLRASERLCAHVAALVRHHLRLGFLVHQMPLNAHGIYRYLRACEPVGAEVTLLTVADRLATRGHGSEPAIARHLELARELLGPALQWRQRRPRPPVRGDELARRLGLAPGPELGRVLAELEEAAYAGEVTGPEEALRRARELLGRPEDRAR